MGIAKNGKCNIYTNLNYTYISDLAVGAYQSAEVFLFYGLRIIDFNVTLTTNITSIKGDTFMKVTPCIFFSQRSSKQILEKSKFLVKLSFDYRTDRKMFEEEWDVPYKAKTCKDINVKVKVFVLI